MCEEKMKETELIDVILQDSVYFTISLKLIANEN